MIKDIDKEHFTSENTKIHSALNINGIVLFDGYCNLCSWSVNFILKRDKSDFFRFVSIQSIIGKNLIEKFQISEVSESSVVLIKNKSVYIKSEAALQIIKKLCCLWPLLYVFMIIPKRLRDSIYSIIAKNRNKWFGVMDSCYLPTNQSVGKFL